MPESEALGGQKRRRMRDRLPPGGRGGAGRRGSPEDPGEKLTVRNWSFYRPGATRESASK